MDSLKRIYQLNDETDFLNSYVMSDKFGNSEAKKTALNLLYSNILEITDSNYYDLNYSGYASIFGVYTFEALGSLLSNMPFTPVDGNLYKIVIKVKNIDAKIHFCEYHIQSNGDDLNGKNKYYTRFGATQAAAISAGFSEYTLSPFNYIEGIQQIQATDNTDISNETDDYLSTNLILSITPQSPDSFIRLEVAFLMKGANTATAVQFKVLENGAEYLETSVFYVGNKTLTNAAVLLVPSHADSDPLIYELQFKNIDGAVDILGSQKFSSGVLTETYTNQR